MKAIKTILKVPPCPRCEVRSLLELKIEDVVLNGPTGDFLMSREGGPARLILEAWLEMAPKGESSWRITAVLAAMNKAGFNIYDISNFTRWLKRCYGLESYESAVAGARNARGGK